MMYKGLSWKKIMQLTGVGLLSITLVACGSESETVDDDSSVSDSTEEVSKDRVLTDAMGNEVTIPAEPKRVIATYLEDYLVALGITPVAQWSVKDGKSVQLYLQEHLEGIPTIAHDLPFESVQGFEPDLLIMDSAAMVEGGKYDQYNQIAPTYVIGTEVNNDWRDELLRVGEVFGMDKQAEEVLSNYDAKAKDAKETLSKDGELPSAAAIWLIGGKFFMVSETLSSGAVMYGDLGLEVPTVVKEISASATGNWSEISLEKLVELDADHLFLINSDTASETTPLSDALWQSIPAVAAGNLHEISTERSWLYTGPVANDMIIDDILTNIAK